MPAGRCLVCERTGDWATALRSALGSNATRIVETRSWSDLVVELQDAPASVVCLESAGTPPDELVRRLGRLHRDFPLARAIVLADPATIDGEPAWRDVGVVEVARTRRDLRAAARIVERHCGSLADRDDSFRAGLWRRLPWGDEGAGVG